MTEATIIKGKFKDILNHLGTMGGIEAVGDYLPIFIASLLDGFPDRQTKEIGLRELVVSVRAHWDSLEDYQKATRQ